MRYQFVDCRWELGSPGRGRELYLAGHIPGASFLDVEADLSSPPGPGGRHPLPEPARFAAAAGRAGIGDGAFVIAYGSMGGAERLWWLLRHYGHDDCAVLALDGWLGELRTGEEQVEPARLSLRRRSGDTIEAEDLQRRVGDLVLLDARVPERYRGDVEPIDPVAGHIPGARNAPWNEALPEIPPGDLVAYCGSGVTACVTVHRLALAGRDAKLYPGSWSEWSGLGLPAERDPTTGSRTKR
ncbi:MAG TPA: rhodanese-like domain-containing protein [Gaiellaceae bacterium]